jgi:hypothetical protein
MMRSENEAKFKDQDIRQLSLLQPARITVLQACAPTRDVLCAEGENTARETGNKYKINFKHGRRDRGLEKMPNTPTLSMLILPLQCKTVETISHLTSSELISTRYITTVSSDYFPNVL